MLNYVPAKQPSLGLCLIVAASEVGDLGDLATSLSDRGVATVRLVRRASFPRATAAETLFATQREILEGLHFADTHGGAVLIVTDIEALPSLLALMRGRPDEVSARAAVLLIRDKVEELESLSAEVIRRLSS